MTSFFLRVLLCVCFCAAGALVLSGHAYAAPDEPASFGRLRPLDIAPTPRLGPSLTSNPRLERSTLAASLRSPAEALPNLTALSRGGWQICDPCKRKRNWELIIAPYAWLAGVSGTAWQDGKSEDFKISFEDLLDVASGGFMLYAEFRIKRWFVAFDGTWAVLQKDFPWRLGTIGFKQEQKILEFRVGYRVFGPAHGQPSDCECSVCPPPAKDRLGVDVYLGARYWDSETTLRIGIGPGAFEGSTEDDWLDPFVGARIGYQLAPRWTLGFRLDVGGFRVGEASKFTSNSFLGFNWKFSGHWSLALGYRAMVLDRVEGSGSSRSGVRTVQQGPLIGLAWSL